MWHNVGEVEEVRFFGVARGAFRSCLEDLKLSAKFEHILVLIHMLKFFSLGLKFSPPLSTPVWRS